MSKALLVCGVVATSAFGVAGTAHAESIFVENHSFETIVITDGSFVAGAPDGWTRLSGPVGKFNPAVDAFPGEAPDGYNTAYSNGGSIAQVLVATMEANTLYTLRVEIGDRAENPFPGYHVELWAGSDLLNADNNSFAPPGKGFDTSIVTFLALPEDPRIGQSLEIRLVGLGNQVNFDNVTLSGVPIPTPGTLALLAAAALISRRRRR
jgi:MYXO-CTERM domain-containing protein